MVEFFKKSIAAADFAQVMWEEVRDWPAKHGAAFKADFGDSLAIESDAPHPEGGDSTLIETIDDVFDEMVYFLSFGTDFAFFLALQDPVRVAGRGAFGAHLTQFACDHRCKPLPPGEWLGDSWMWMQNGPSPVEIGRPLANLDQRFALYTAALQRGKGQQKSSGECVSYLLGAWCGIKDAAFLVYATTLFNHHYIGVMNVIKQFRVTV
jgi:hypothetical protein